MSNVLYGDPLEPCALFTDCKLLSYEELDRFTRDFSKVERKKMDEKRMRKNEQTIVAANERDTSKTCYEETGGSIESGALQRKQPIGQRGIKISSHYLGYT